MDIATSTISLFNAALDCFERIQLARSFDQDFATHQLKLDIIQVRLSRWGEAAGIIQAAQDAQSTTSGTARTTSKLIPIESCDKVDELLRNIQILYEQARHDSEKIRPQTSTDEDVMDPEKDMPPLMKSLRLKLRDCLRKRGSQISNAAHGIQWSIYKKDQLQRLLDGISGLVEDLERLFPPEEAKSKLQELSNEECESIGKIHFKTLQEIAQGYDPWLSVAVEEALEKDSGGVSFSAQNNYGLQLGKNYGGMHGLSFGTGNTTNNHWK
ncbi:Heterokaryon incompatibility protein s [Lasiodiplodia theobromae]|uniref:Heterokaryon incompatibility protein s n=1 Tax=Lasiodiplodia theobromae TaxID=45133 RepID=A0A5N5CUL0_9PEZI|nr:Heterokaryon incompatibility protein s [Lasiodiplodia theobromae]